LAPAPSVQAESARAAVLPSATDVKSLFSVLEIRRTERGGISIEAPPEAAATLAALFEGMASMLRVQAAG